MKNSASSNPCMPYQLSKFIAYSYLMLLSFGLTCQQACSNMPFQIQSTTLQGPNAENPIPSAPPPTPPLSSISDFAYGALTSTTQPNLTFTKKEAKAKAKACLIQAHKEIRKCFHYDSKINQLIHEEEKWSKSSQGWFVKKWVSNVMLYNKFRNKASQIGRLKARLEMAEIKLNQTQPYITHALHLHSKKAWKRLHKQKIELEAQITVIREAMTVYNT